MNIIDEKCKKCDKDSGCEEIMNGDNCEDKYQKRRGNRESQIQRRRRREKKKLTMSGKKEDEKEKKIMDGN